jgi:hypothetical protein
MRVILTSALTSAATSGGLILLTMYHYGVLQW